LELISTFALQLRKAIGRVINGFVVKFGG